MQYTVSGRVPRRTLVWLAAGVCVVGIGFAASSASSAEEQLIPERTDLLRAVLNAHVENITKIRTVEGRALLTVYSRVEDKPSNQVEDVTQHVKVRYAWDRPEKRRWSEYQITECLVGGCIAPPEHPRWVSMRDLIDGEKHVRLSGSGTLPPLHAPSDATPPEVLTAGGTWVVSISPLHDEVESLLSLREEGMPVGVSYNAFSADFDIRYYFHLGQDIHDLLALQIGALEKDPSLRYPAVRAVSSEGKQLVEIKDTCRGPGGRGERVLTYVFDMGQGGAIVRKEWVDTGVTTWDYVADYAYLREQGIWFPSSVRVRRWALDRESGTTQLVKNLQADFGIRTRINLPWSTPEFFALEGLGVRQGDLVIDEIEGKSYRYGEE